jgi:hypothetical protein
MSWHTIRAIIETKSFQHIDVEAIRITTPIRNDYKTLEMEPQHLLHKWYPNLRPLLPANRTVSIMSRWKYNQYDFPVHSKLCLDFHYSTTNKKINQRAFKGRFHTNRLFSDYEQNDVLDKNSTPTRSINELKFFAALLYTQAL